MNRNELANVITEYSHTITSKLVAVVGGTSAVSHTSAGNWLADSFDWFVNWPWMTALSYVAIILLIIERSFIVWAWSRSTFRGKSLRSWVRGLFRSNKQ